MPPKTDKSFNLWVLLQQTRDAVYNAREKELSQYSITQREAAILRAINSLGKSATPANLARWVYRRPHTISGILKRMKRKGFINLTNDPAIRNIIRISLTEKGREAYKTTLKRKSLHRIFKSVIEDNCDQLESCLTEIRDRALKETGDEIHRPLP